MIIFSKFIRLLFLNNVKKIKYNYNVYFFRNYFLLILLTFNKTNKFKIKKLKKKLSFHKFDSFDYYFFNLIKYKKLFLFNKNNKNKSICGTKVNYNKKSKLYKLIKLLIYTKKNNFVCIYNIININFNLYNYKMYALFCNNFGNFYYIPYAHNCNLFKFYMLSSQYSREITKIKIPYLYSIIAKLKLSTIVFNVYANYVFNAQLNKIVYCRAVGSVGKIIMHNKTKLLTYINLPSKKNIYILSTSFCFIYFNQIFKIEEARKIPKASIKLNRGYKSSVRGIAKNAVDHPHGGNTNIIKVKKNPWGKSN